MERLLVRTLLFASILCIAACSDDPQGVELQSAALDIESSMEEDVLASSQSTVAGAPDGEPVYLGLVEPLRIADVSFDVPGKVLKVHALLGDTVTRGQLLAELETESRKQKLADARTMLSQARASRPNASRSTPDAPPPQWMVDEAERIKAEAEKKAQAASGDRWDFQRTARREGEEAARDRAIAMATRRMGSKPSTTKVRIAAEDSLALALMDDIDQRVRQLQDAVENSSLRSPMDGIVVGVTVRQGEEWNTRNVDPAFQLVDPSSFVVQIVIPMRRAKQLAEGELAWVELPAQGKSPVQVVQGRWLTVGDESSQLAGGTAWVNATFQLPSNLPRRVHMGEEVRVVLPSAP